MLAFILNKPRKLCLIQSHLKYESAQTGAFLESQFILLAPANEHLSDTCCFPAVARRELLLPLLWTMLVGQSDDCDLELMKARTRVSATVSGAGLEHLREFFSSGLTGVSS